MQTRTRITFRELKTLPVRTLEVIAVSIAGDVDRGAFDKQPMLERVIKVIEERVPCSS